MRCQNCSAENPPSARFCIQCAEPLARRCQSCGFVNPSQARFCAQCAAPLDATAPPRAEAEAGAAPAGERRHLTVLFCDLVGSTEIASHLDPEEWREIVAGYHKAAAQAIERFDGHVAKYLGDGVMAFFGYPEAHDNDAERAARAGLAALEAISKLNGHRTHPQLSARVGIDSGTVVVGAGAGKDIDVFGDTPNIAARVQAAAAPGTVLVTADTHRLISGLFVVEDRGTPALKGVEPPIRLYRVVQPSGVRGRLGAAAAARGLTPFVGREDELRLLMNRWQRVLDGEGQLALIAGEAGIGKSRLVQRFREQIAGTPHTWVEASAEAFFQNTPFYAVTELLRELLAWRGDEPAEEQLAQLEKRLELAGLKPAEALPLIATLLKLPLPAGYSPPPLSPEQQRRRLLATLTKWALGAARAQPTVIAIEDVHWADPSTLEVIQLLAEQCSTAPLLLICTARPEFRVPWLMRPYHTLLTLNRLSPRSAREMVARLAEHARLAAATVDAMVERSGGVPLFVEELTRSVLEGGDGESALREIPVTLHDSLMARLDRLGEAREIAQLASVLGREFSWERLSAVAAIEDEKLEEALRKLTDAELLSVQGIAPEAGYRFRHALIQAAAYESLLKSRREQYHRRIAQTLVERFPETAEAQPELLAHHYTEANLKQEALAQWQLAGQQAVQRSANFEAVSHFSRALELLKSLPAGPERFQQELALQLAVGTALIVTTGFGSAEVGKAYARARELCPQTGEPRQLFPVLWGLWMFYMARAEHAVARDLATRCLRMAQNTKDTGFLVQAHHVNGVGLIAAGDFAQALEHLEQATAIYDPAQHGMHANIYGHDPAAVSLTHASWSLWLLGRPDRALEKCSEGLARAQNLNHAYTSATVAAFAAWLHQFRRNSQSVEELAATAIRISTEHDFPFYRAMGIMMHGWALTQRGQELDGIAQMRAGLDEYHRTGAVVLRPGYLSLLAEACGNAGQPEEGLSLLAEAQDLATECEERWWQAELHRLKGELILKRAGAQSLPVNIENKAEDCFRQALTVAREQKAKSLELRAAMSLSRLGLRQARRPEGRRLVEESLAFFTEGFDTPDLLDAKKLLQQL